MSQASANEATLLYFYRMNHLFARMNPEESQSGQRDFKPSDFLWIEDQSGVSTMARTETGPSSPEGSSGSPAL